MKIDTPAIYRIKVQGTLDAEWAENVGGLAITSVNANGDVDLADAILVLTELTLSLYFTLNRRTPPEWLTLIS